MAPTPMAMQTKKKISRRQAPAQLAADHAQDEAHRSPTRPRTRGRRGHGRRGDDAAVPERQLDVGPRRQGGVVGHQHQRRAAPGVHVEQQVDDVLAVGRVEVAGRLVGHDDGRLVRQRARHRDALLLAARELRRIVMPAAGQARPRRAGPWPASVAWRRPAISIGTSTFSNAVSDGTRWKNWKTKPMARPRSRARASSPSLVMSVPSMRISPVRRLVEAGHQADQRRLAAAGRPDDGEPLAGLHVQIERMQDGQRLAAARHRLRDAAQIDHERVIMNATRP